MSRLATTHACAKPDCSVQVPLNKLMCRAHWFLVPRNIQQRIYNAYVPGQEYNTSIITDSYRQAMRAAIAAVTKAKSD